MSKIYYFMKEDNKYLNRLITTKKIKIFPNKEQIEYFTRCFGIHRYVWNLCVDKFIENEENFNEYDFKKELNSLALTKEYDFFNDVNSMVRQECLSIFKMCLNQYKDKQNYLYENGKIPDINFGRLLKKEEQQSFRYNNKGNPLKTNGRRHFLLTTCKRYGKRLNIKCAESLLFLNSEDIRFISITIKKEFDSYYVCIMYEKTNHKEYKNHNYEKIGIDMGVKIPLTCTYYEKDSIYSIQSDLPKLLKTLHKRLEYLDSKLSKKVYKSKNYNKLLYKINKLNKKISNIRREEIFQNVNFLCKEFKTIIYEDFKANYSNDGFKYDHHRLNDISKYFFLEQLYHKSKFYNNEIIQVKIGTPTTQTCSSCGHVFKDNKKLTLNDRVYKCPNCGLKLDRDINASINILNYSY